MIAMNFRLFAFSAFFFLSSFQSFSSSAESPLPKTMAEMKADKEKLQYYISGSVELKGLIPPIQVGYETQYNSLEIFIRNGSLNRWTSWLGRRKTSYYKIHRQTFGQENAPAHLAQEEYFRGPIDVEATEKGLAIRFFAPSPEGTTDFGASDLRKVTIAYIHVPHANLFRAGEARINFVSKNLMLGSTGQKPTNVDDVNGFFWAKEGHLLGQAQAIALADSSISKAKEFSAYTVNKTKGAAASCAYFTKTAYDLARSSYGDSSYDLAMMSLNILAATGELYLALNEVAMLNPLAVPHFKMAVDSSKNAVEHYHKFMGSSDDIAKNNIAYLDYVVQIATNSEWAVSKLVSIPTKIYSLDATVLLELAQTARAVKAAWTTAYPEAVPPAA